MMYTLKPHSTPLPSQAKTEAAKQGSEQPATPQFRDITEDDDGYHPYADDPDARPIFEPKPWDKVTNYPTQAHSRAHR